jgi:hypothetical protein
LEAAFRHVFGKELVDEGDAFGDLVCRFVVEKDWNFGVEGGYEGDSSAHLACTEDA